MNRASLLTIILPLILALAIAFGSGIAEAQRTQRPEEVIDQLLLRFYEKHQIPGGISLAISRNDRLVYAGAVGYADRNRTVKLTPQHRMRIASVSKPVTAIAVMKLIEDRKLRLDGFVFGENGVFQNRYGMPTFRDMPVDIRVRHLLNHSSGWCRSMDNNWFRDPNIARRIERLPLEHPPGTYFRYSNYGYYLLGKIIETISGMSYENYVKENILKPSGIDGMRIGAARSGPDEVEYIRGSDGRNPPTALLIQKFGIQAIEFGHLQNFCYSRGVSFVCLGV